MLSHVQVETAAELHIDEVLPHFRAYQSSYGAFAGATEEETRRFLLELMHDEREGTVLIARVDSRVAGFATAFPTRSGVMASKMFHLGDLYVAPPYRGQRIGERLVKAVRVEAARRGLPLVRWLSAASNERLNAWYEALGAKSYDFRLFLLQARDE